MAGHSNTGSRQRRRKRIMRSLKINEISAVDRPAQAGARAVIMKRANDPDGADPKEGDVAKVTALTDEVENFAHLVTLVSFEGEERNSGQTSFDNEHSHPWIRTVDGEIVIGAADGHTHVIDQVSKAENQEDDMTTENENKAAEALKAATDRTEELETQLADATARAEMDDAQKAHFDALDPQLDDDVRKAFVSAKPAERAAIVEKAARAKEDSKDVVYKAADGTEYTRADDPRLTAQAKKNDDLAKRLAEAQEVTKTDDLRKRADTDLVNMPGDVETRMAMLRAVDAIEDETTRKAALESLKAQNESMSKAFENVGSRARTEPGADSPEGKLNALAKGYAKDHEGVTDAAAYDAVLQTDEGGRLYGEMTGDAEYIN